MAYDPLLFCLEKRYSRHKQSAEFVAIKRPLKKPNQSLSLEGIFWGGERGFRGQLQGEGLPPPLAKTTVSFVRS